MQRTIGVEVLRQCQQAGNCSPKPLSASLHIQTQKSRGSAIAHAYTSLVGNLYCFVAWSYKCTRSYITPIFNVWLITVIKIWYISHFMLSFHCCITNVISLSISKYARPFGMGLRHEILVVVCEDIQQRNFVNASGWYGHYDHLGFSQSIQQSSQ